MSSEAVEVLARVMADLIARDTRQFTALTDLFKDAFSKEYADSDEDAQAFRFDGALDSDMMSPRTGASLAGDWWHR